MRGGSRLAAFCFPPTAMTRTGLRKLRKFCTAPAHRTSRPPAKPAPISRKQTDPYGAPVKVIPDVTGGSSCPPSASSPSGRLLPGLPPPCLPRGLPRNETRPILSLRFRIHYSSFVIYSFIFLFLA